MKVNTLMMKIVHYLWWFKGECPPKSHIFECYFTNCFRKEGGLLKGVCHWEWDLRFQTPIPACLLSLMLIKCKLSATAPKKKCLYVCCHVLCYDSNGWPIWSYKQTSKLNVLFFLLSSYLAGHPVSSQK